ncbi:AAA family ATPase [Marivivens aquimaris]|uniref:AAA family ATPase n=1 Tax=Marivivens aquimaris TaxID=2774876 RepID=UPI0018813C87|nr:AAA family ATPase [Marivivens aquimaris]
MVSQAAIQPEPQPILACTVSRDVQVFDLLIEDMENAMGEGWGDLGFEDALAFLGQAEADSLQFIAVALDHEDESDLGRVTEVISAAKSRGIKVILITEDLSPSAIHTLLRQGGDEFLPYPLPEGELGHAIERVMKAPEPIAVVEEKKPTLAPTNDRSGVVIGVQGMSGGVGATTLAVNLAWELANVDKKSPHRVCLIDLDLQYGSTSTYLDLPRRDAVLEMLTDTENMDSEVFLQALQPFKEQLYVLTSPPELIPVDLIGPDDVARILEMAEANFDYVVVDMPSVMVEWSQTVLEASAVYFGVTEMDMRCAQNIVRLKRALSAEELPVEKMRYVLNRAPKFTDLNGKSRVKRLGESLGISVEVQLPDGGKQVTQSNDHGTPLAETAGRNPLRKEIAKLAKSVHDVNLQDAAESKG